MTGRPDAGPSPGEPPEPPARPTPVAHDPAEPGSPHRLVTAVGGLPPPSGYAHAVVAASGTVVLLAGQTAQGPDGTIQGATVVEQLDVAAGNVVAALAAAGGGPQDLVALTIYVTDMAGYRRSLGEIGVAYRRHFGRHYPAMALLGVAELFDPAALVELVGLAVLPDGSDGLDGSDGR